jgi:hypothetical protein
MISGVSEPDLLIAAPLWPKRRGFLKVIDLNVKYQSSMGDKEIFEAVAKSVKRLTI